MGIDAVYDAHGIECKPRGDLVHLLPDPGPLPDEIVAMCEEGDLDLNDTDCLSSLRSCNPEAIEALGAFLRWCFGKNQPGGRRIRHACERFIMATCIIRPDLVGSLSLEAIGSVFGVTRSNISLVHRKVGHELGGARMNAGRSTEAREHYSARQRRIWSERKAAKPGRQLKPKKPRKPRYTPDQWKKLASQADPETRAEFSTRSVSNAWRSYRTALADYELRLTKWRSARAAAKAAKAKPRKTKPARARSSRAAKHNRKS